MKIQDIKLSKFRSYDNLKLSFAPNVNILYGKNGVGKTNLVESIYVLALTKSFRTNNDKNLLMKDCEETSVEGTILTNVSTKYRIILGNDGKKVEIEGNKVEKISDYVSRINVILYNPEDINIINDSPNIRRKFLNVEISQISKEYLLFLNYYNKLLKHRNSYLKELYINGNGHQEYLDILTKKLIEYGIKINKYRQSFVDDINEYIGRIYKNIFGYGDIFVKYISSYNNQDEESLFKEYQKLYSKEMAFGKTLIGIHHDDLEFLLDHENIRDWGSQGQKKNVIISLKLAEILLIKSIRNDYPILILDDLFSELDHEKIKNILKMLDDYVQTFITTTEINKRLIKGFNECKIFKVEQGSIEEE